MPGGLALMDKLSPDPLREIRQTPANSLRKLLNVEMKSFMTSIHKSNNPIFDKSAIISQVAGLIKNIKDKYQASNTLSKINLQGTTDNTINSLEQFKTKLQENTSNTITKEKLIKIIQNIANPTTMSDGSLDITLPTPGASAASPAPTPAPAPTYFKIDNKVYKVIKVTGDKVFASELIRTPTPAWSTTETEFTKAEVDNAEKIQCPPITTGGARKSRRHRKHSKKQKKHRKTRRA